MPILLDSSPTARWIRGPTNPRRADSNRADGFCCAPSGWRDHLIGARGSAAGASNCVCPARPPDPRDAMVGRRQTKPRPPGGCGSAQVFGFPDAVPSNDPVGSDGWLHRDAGAIRACHRVTCAKQVVAPIEGCTKRTICASAQAPRRGRPARLPTNWECRR